MNVIAVENTKVQIFFLVLNPMRSNTEAADIVAWAYYLDKVQNWYKSQRCEEYTDEGAPSFPVHGKTHQWAKSFKKGSPLEWYNPASIELGQTGFYGHGMHMKWVSMEVAEELKYEYNHIA